MPLRACPKCQHNFYQIMEQSSNTHYVMCSSCGSLIGTFQESKQENTKEG